MLRLVLAYVVGSMVISTAYAQSAYHYECKADAAVGFTFDETARSWRPATVNASDDTYTVRALSQSDIDRQMPSQKGLTWGVFRPGEVYTLLECHDPDANGLFCGGAAIQFRLNSAALRFQRYYQGGYIWGRDNNEDTPLVETGRCTISTKAIPR